MKHDRNGKRLSELNLNEWIAEAEYHGRRNAAEEDDWPGYVHWWDVPDECPVIWRSQVQQAHADSFDRHSGGGWR